MSLTLAEARHRAALLAVSSYDVLLELTDPASFRSRTTIRFTAAGAGDTFAELVGALDASALLDGAPVPVDLDGGRIAVELAPGEHELVVDARLPYVTDGEGMNTFTDPEDGARYVGAYCGMDVAHKVFACFDQPDLKARVTLEVTAPADWTVLANGTSSRQGGHWAFSTTPPIPPYLFVVCAGPWHSVPFSHAGLPFGWHARRSLAARLDRDAEDLVALTTACFDHLTGTFTEPYPFDSYDQVFVPGHNWGAMETAGCVTFNEGYLTRSAPTATERLGTACVVAHEMTHMWFGDLATMRWWEDSWLNESFADYSGYQVTDALGFDGAWVDGALSRKPTAYVADARRSTHPVAEDTDAMVDVDTAFGNFDMITYAKGNAVLRQLVTWIGEEEFLAGANAYLHGHAFANADLGDFLDALDGVSDRDVRGWSGAWLQTTGFDTIRVDRDRDVPVLHRDGSRPHRFRVGGYDATGALIATRTVDLGSAPVPLPDLAGLRVVPNDQEETYARVVLDDDGWALTTARLSAVADPLTRAMLWTNAIGRVADGAVPVNVLAALARDHLAPERDPVVVAGVLDLFDRRVPQWLGPEELGPFRSILAGVAREQLVEGPEEVRLTCLRALIACSGDAAVLADWLQQGEVLGQHLPADERWLVAQRLAALDAAPEELLEAEAARDRSESGRLALLHARAARPTEAAKSAAWAVMGDPGSSNRDYQAAAAGLWTCEQGVLVGPWVDAYLHDSPALARQRGQAFGQVIGRAFPFVALPLEELRRLRDALAGALDGDVPTVLRRSWNDRLDDLDVALRVRGATPAQPRER
ncbi:MAG: aminopeptidase N [Marmoricola sp.]